MTRATKARTYTLRRASSVVFALISGLPLLLFAYTLYALDVLHRFVAQVGLASALVCSMLGLYIYSIMMSQLADLLLDIETGVASLPPAGAPQGPLVTPAAEHGPGDAAAASDVAAGSRHAPAVLARPPSPSSARRRAGAAGRGGLVVPGMGRISAKRPATASALSELDSMWRAEAEPLLGKRVVVMVRNTPDPIKGLLAQVARDGVIIDQDGIQAGISYTRVSAIELDSEPGPA